MSCAQAAAAGARKEASGTLPDVICWHELGGWKNVTNDVQAYRSLEQQLGISARPISIDEYATTSEIDVPSSTNHYVAQFERDGVRDAERAFWYEAGTLNGLLYNNQPTASYWMYKWYGDQTGNVVKVRPTQNQDGVAAYDAAAYGPNAPIRLAFFAITAKAGPCGEWPEDLVENTVENRNYHNFGCATQANLAAQIANPMDLVQPRGMSAIDAEQRNVVIQDYRKNGQPDF